MPYITKNRRQSIEINNTAIDMTDLESAGELNYSITLILKRYLEIKGLSYQTINDVVGALEGAKLEFTRRVTNFYEDKKIKENGDVY